MNNKDWKGDIQYVKGMVSSLVSRDVYMEFDHLEAGEYYLFTEIDWHPTTIYHEFCATCYG